MMSYAPAKRCSSDLASDLSEAMATNGSSQHTSQANNDAKKVKRDNPSRVVHIRNIPTEVTEPEIIQLGIPFGTVSNVLVLKGKNQAFLEMIDIATATRMVDYFYNTSAQLRGHIVYVQFSNHQQLNTNQTHSNANASAQAAIQSASVMSGGNGDSAANVGMGGGADNQGPNTVLRVVIDNMIYPVTLDVLFEIFSRIGRVLRIVTFTKTGSFQALIQYPDVVTAQAAKMQLDSQNIYNQCCTLRVNFSHLTKLNVRYNNDKSRDYTNPELPTGHMPGAGNSLLGNVPGPLSSLQYPGMMSNGGGSASCGGGGAMGADGSGGGMPFQNMAQQQLQAFPGYQQQLQQHPGGSVLLVSNLDDKMVTTDNLFNLFGAFGDVMRVKILFNKKDNALIEMRDPNNAGLALTHLDGAVVWGRALRVAPSKHATIQMPRADQPDAGLNHDYTDCRQHRYSRAAAIGVPPQHVYRPSDTLHLSNIASADSTEQAIRQHFTDAGFTVRAFKFISSRREADSGSRRDHSMALIQLKTAEEAIMALMTLHNKELNGSRVRVSFTKSTI